MKRAFSAILESLLIAAVFSSSLFAGSIRDTKHNLSVNGPGLVRSSSEDRICLFCHTPHQARSDVSYLWNRSDSVAHYIPYDSSTLHASVGQPTGASKLCLSCHDGTIAMGAVISEQQEMPFQGGVRFMPEGRAKVGTDLTDDHPVSFVYDASIARQNGDLADPSVLPPQVRLDAGDQVQCTSCHNPHDDAYGKFLVMDNRNAALCTACHQKNGWAQSVHASTQAAWQNPDAVYTSVAENGCRICHLPHSAGGRERLLRYRFEEDNCIACHNGTTAATDVEKEILRPYRHGVQNYVGVHDAAEDFTTAVSAHVECQDCHNPHEIVDSPSAGPGTVSGANKSVSGVDIAGQPIPWSEHVYEICFKCHADRPVSTALPVTRQIAQLDVRMEFDPSNPSFHPVAAAGVNPDVPSLLPPYSINSIISCTDCHAGSDPTGVKGPHGSNYPYLLEKNYVTRDNTPETAAAYDLCYKCHSRSSILGNESFRHHRLHIVEERTPCAICHDPHGISGVQGDPSANSHLINFDLTAVGPDSQGRLYWEDRGRFSGTCYLRCHGENHGGGD